MDVFTPFSTQKKEIVFAALSLMRKLGNHTLEHGRSIFFQYSDINSFYNSGSVSNHFETHKDIRSKV